MSIRTVHRRTRNAASQQCARKRTIKQRGNKCERCGYPGGFIELHHIVEAVDGGTFADENLLLLCELCHCEAHGWKKRNFIDPQREYWKPS
jgi:hypothetical protein